MISSEVQRTLVKSPPELWSELSDPESLARHLGELGEIRITRTEPENLVEWEAEGTTGTVEIEPSGWGTRVKLTVARESPAETGVEGALDAQESTGAGLHGEAVATDDAASPEAGPDAGAPDVSETTLREAEAAEEPAEYEPAADADSAPVNRIADHKPAPATEAARRAAGWPAGGHAPGPAIESDLRAAEALEGAPAEPDGMHEWAAQTIEPDEAEPTDEYVPEEEPEQPKRGLFARLFGRRRGRAKTAPLAEPERDVFDDADETAPADTSDSEAQELESQEDAHAEAETGEFEPVANEPAPTGPRDEIESEVEPAGPAHEAGAEDLEAAAQELDEPTTEDETELAPADLAALGVPEPEAAEPTAGARADTAAQVDTETQTATTPQAEEPPQAGTPVEDLSAELRAAEEVEAVLAAVLDRLGSAHHRPFSRP